MSTITRITLWALSFATLRQCGPKQFAEILARHLETNMRRLRLGGLDPFSVYDKAWRDAVKAYVPQYSGSRRRDLQRTLDTGLGMIIKHHAYGPAIALLLKLRSAKSALDDKPAERVA